MIYWAVVFLVTFLVGQDGINRTGSYENFFGVCTTVGLVGMLITGLIMGLSQIMELGSIIYHFLF